MQYTIIITHADGTQTRTSTNATNTKTAHEWARQFITNTASGFDTLSADKRHLAFMTAQQEQHPTKTRAKQIEKVTANIERKENELATVRVYPTTQDEHGNINAYAVLRGALQVAKKSAEKTLSRTGGTETQQRIANELTGANARAGQPQAEQLGATYILDMIARLSADSQDIFSCAYDGILTAINDGADITEQYHNAYLTINAHIMAQRSATEYETSTEFIEENGGHLVAVSSYIARIIKNGERYTPTDTETMDAETADKLGAVLSACAVALTPRQKEITILTARGYSQRQIADKLKVKDVSTIQEHLRHIRKKYIDYITENAPEFLTLINSAQVNATADKRAKDRYTKEQRAEYMRKYRATKKATANA